MNANAHATAHDRTAKLPEQTLDAAIAASPTLQAFCHFGNLVEAQERGQFRRAAEAQESLEQLGCLVTFTSPTTSIGRRPRRKKP